jgi:hypothetical protein
MNNKKEAFLVTALTIFFVLAVATGSSGHRVVTGSLPPMADLTFERGTYDKTNLKVRLYLINNGQIASSDCTVTLKAAKNKTGTLDQETVKFDQALSVLNPGARLTITFDLPKPGEFSFSPLYANADSANVVRESNEKNNEWSFLKIGGSVSVPTPKP